MPRIENSTRLIVETDSLDPYEATLDSFLGAEDFSEEETSEIIEALEQCGDYRADDAAHGVWLNVKVVARLTDSDVEAMIDAAFEALARRHPEATSGDFPPDALDAITCEMRIAASYWLDLNTVKP